MSDEVWLWLLKGFRKMIVGMFSKMDNLQNLKWHIFENQNYTWKSSHEILRTRIMTDVLGEISERESGKWVACLMVLSNVCLEGLNNVLISTVTVAGIWLGFEPDIPIMQLAHYCHFRLLITWPLARYLQMQICNSILYIVYWLLYPMLFRNGMNIYQHYWPLRNDAEKSDECSRAVSERKENLWTL
jgi:hypothetical protein